jgi:hypothetical protein
MILIDVNVLLENFSTENLLVGYPHKTAIVNFTASGSNQRFRNKQRRLPSAMTKTPLKSAVPAFSSE